MQNQMENLMEDEVETGFEGGLRGMITCTAVFSLRKYGTGYLEMVIFWY